MIAEVEKGLVWAVVLFDDNNPRKSSLEAVAEAAMLAGKLRKPTAAAILSTGELSPTACSNLGTQKLYQIKIPGMKPERWQAGQVSKPLSGLFSQADPEAVFFGNGELERETVARLAAIDGKYAPALDYSNIQLPVTALNSDKDNPQSRFTFTRPAFKGKASATINVCPGKVPLFLLPRRSGKPPVPKSSGQPDLKVITVDPDNGLSKAPRLLDRIKDDIATISLVDASIIVAGGAGVEDRLGFGMVEELARVLKGKAAASRKAVDMGLATPDMMVGLSGKTTAPDLYIACGISGASQHISGMQDADNIIAINIDRHAPIAAMADFFMVGKVKEVIPPLIKELGKAK